MSNEKKKASLTWKKKSLDLVGPQCLVEAMEDGRGRLRPYWVIYCARKGNPLFGSYYCPYNTTYHLCLSAE